MKHKYVLLPTLFLILGAGCAPGPETNFPQKTEPISKIVQMAQHMRTKLSHDADEPIEIFPFVKHNFTDLDSIERISKFRGGYGHDFSFGTNETCRSMKHYFWAPGEPGKPHNPLWMSIPYYAPVDGTIQDLQYRTYGAFEIESQFSIKSDEYPSVHFLFFHMKLDEGIAEGSHIKAGQKIGTVGNEDAHVEIGVEKRGKYGRSSELISFFDVITNDLFAEYEARGMISRQDAVISKEERDTSPLECDYSTEAGFFIPQGDTETYQEWQTSKDNWIFLN